MLIILSLTGIQLVGSRADAFPLENPTYPVTYVGIVQTMSDVKPHQPSNHGTSRRPMTMATLAPTGWIPFIQRKELLTDALIYVRTAAFSQKLIINQFIYSYYTLHVCAITIPISSTDHGGCDGHNRRPQWLRCNEQLPNALNNNNLAQFYF